MKRLMLVPSIALLFLTSCGTLDPAGVYSGDKPAYSYSLAITTSKEVVETFLGWEKQNRTVLLASAPDIVDAARKLRVNFPIWSKSAVALLDVYNATPTKDTEGQLLAAIKVLRQAMLEAAGYMARIATPVGGMQ